MALSHSRGAGPCRICAGDCKAFPDFEVHERYPFMSQAHKDAAKPKADPKPGRPKGKRRPAEDRARRPAEDR